MIFCPTQSLYVLMFNAYDLLMAVSWKIVSKEIYLFPENTDLLETVSFVVMIGKQKWTFHSPPPFLFIGLGNCCLFLGSVSLIW